MRGLILFLIIGFLAQLIDGSLGMAYGATSTSLLLTYGVAPAVASASVHFSEMVTTGVSGISHIKLKNVDKNLVLRLMLPGAFGGFIGAIFLSHLPGSVVKPYIALFLLLLGVVILLKFLIQSFRPAKNPEKSLPNKGVMFLGFIAGFFDSTGGGGWGPIATPILLTSGLPARKVIGSVDTGEWAVATASTLGFFFALGWHEINWLWVVTLMIGGVCAAPLAAWLVKVLPSHLLGVSVGGLIILTNLRTLIEIYQIPNKLILWSYAAVCIIWGLSILITHYMSKRFLIK